MCVCVCVCGEGEIDAVQKNLYLEPGNNSLDFGSSHTTQGNIQSTLLTMDTAYRGQLSTVDSCGVTRVG